MKAPVARISSILALLLGAGLLVVPAVSSRPELVGCPVGRSFAGIEDLSGGRFLGVRAVVAAQTRFSGLDRKGEFLAGWIALGDRRRESVELELRSYGNGERVFPFVGWRHDGLHTQVLNPGSSIPWTVNEPHSFVMVWEPSRSRLHVYVDGAMVKSLAIDGDARGLPFPRVYLTAMNKDRPCNNRGRFLFTSVYVKQAKDGRWVRFPGAARSGFTGPDYPMKRLSSTSFVAGSGVKAGTPWLSVYGGGLTVAFLISLLLVLIWTRRSYARDLGLSLRMFAVTFLLAALYLPFLLLGVVWIYGRTSSVVDAAVALFVELGLVLSIPYFANRAILESTGARLVERGEAPDLHALVERLCALTDLPKPRVAIVASSAPTAFASGTGATATIAVSEGLVNELEPRELEAVVAHELAHIANGDAYVITILNLPAAVLGKIIRPLINAPEQLETTRAKVAGYVAVFSLPLMFLAWLAWTLSTLLVFSISRYREFVADRTAAMIVGAPEQVMSALVRIADKLERIPARDLREATAAEAFSIVALPLPRGSITLDPAKMFPSHPPLEHRLARLGTFARHRRRAKRNTRPLRSKNSVPETMSRRPANPAAWIGLALGVITLFLLLPEINSPNWGITAVAALVVSSYGAPFAFHALARSQRGAAGLPSATTGLILCLIPWLTFILGALSFVAAASLHWVHLIHRT